MSLALWMRDVKMTSAAAVQQEREVLLLPQNLQIWLLWVIMELKEGKDNALFTLLFVRSWTVPAVKDIILGG